MNEPTNTISVDILQQYSSKDAIMLGQLLTHLSSRFTGEPVTEHLLTAIINSSSHALFTARTSDGTIIGCATLSTVLGISSGRCAQLEDFVVSPDYRGQGVADLLWSNLIDWCEQQDITKLNFTSNPTRIAAHKFYKKHGAATRDTFVFVKNIQANTIDNNI